MGGGIRTAEGLTMDSYQLTADPALIDFGPSGRAVVFATAPFMCDTTQYAANEAHTIDRGRHGRWSALQLLGKAREGAVKVWPK